MTLKFLAEQVKAGPLADIRNTEVEIHRMEMRRR